MIQNPKRHKHADIIHAWADGAKIQMKYFGKWIDIIEPRFFEKNEYRIKPKKNTVTFRNYLDKDGCVNLTFVCDHAPNFAKWLGDWQEVEIEDND